MFGGLRRVAKLYFTPLDTYIWFAILKSGGLVRLLFPEGSDHRAGGGKGIKGSIDSVAQKKIFGGKVEFSKNCHIKMQ